MEPDRPHGPKVFANGSYVMGFTTSFRMGQLLRYAFTPPEPDTADLHRFMCTAFTDALRQCLKDGGWAQKDKEQEEGGTFLVGTTGTCSSSTNKTTGSGAGRLICGGRLAAAGMLSARSTPPRAARCPAAAPRRGTARQPSGSSSGVRAPVRSRRHGFGMTACATCGAAARSRPHRRPARWPRCGVTPPRRPMVTSREYLRSPSPAGRYATRGMPSARMSRLPGACCHQPGGGQGVGSDAAAEPLAARPVIERTETPDGQGN